VAKIRITVLKRMSNPDLADQLLECDATLPCPEFAEGQQFTVESWQRPEAFCSAAWHDLHPFLLILRQGGNFAGWSKDPSSIVRCCTDGIRPVVFELKRIQE
jgi:uncharacterized repeat protein (TIGR04076 family)